MIDKKYFTLIITLCTVFLFGLADSSHASTIFEDDFNSYNEGSLVGQGGWLDYPGSSKSVAYTVQSFLVNEGAKAIALTGESSDGSPVFKIGESKTDGTITFYFRLSDLNARSLFGLSFNNGTASQFSVSINQRTQGKVSFYMDPVGWTDFESISTNKWHYLQIQWRSSDHKARYSLDGADFTSYFPGLGSWSSGGLDAVVIAGNSSPGSTFYYDTIQENPVDQRNPVLIVPGIMGSRLYEDNDTLWEPLSDNDVQTLYLDEQGKSISDNIYTKDIIDEILSVGGNIYKSLLDDLETKKQNGEIPDYADIPYDWRLSLSDNLFNGKEEADGKIYYTRSADMPYIEKTLRSLAETSSTGKVDVIAHSNGGLLMKALINQLGDQASQLIDNLILVAVPQLGTPKAIGGLLHGYKMGIPELFPVLISSERARDFSNNSPAIYQLLPQRDYYDNIGVTISTPLISFSPGEATQNFIDAYGQEVDTTQELYQFIQGQEGRETPAYNDINSPAIGNDELLSQSISYLDGIGSSWQAPAGITVHQITGIGEDTLSGITYITVKKCVKRLPSIFSELPICLKYEPRVSYIPNEVIDGDDTVVVPSALLMRENDNVKRWWVNLNDFNAPIFGVNRTHSDILEIPSLRTFIFNNLLDKSSISLPEFIFDSQPEITKGKRLKFILHSPLTLSATDKDGNEISETISAVPGARFKRYSDVQVLTTPAESLPELKLTGIEEGTFTVEIQEYDNSTLTAQTTFSGILSSEGTIATMDFTDGTIANAGNLKIDYNGNGAIDIELSGEIGQETTMPEPALSDLLAIFKQYVKELSIKEKLKNKLLKKIEDIEEKIEKKKKENDKIFSKFKKTITKKEMKGKISQADANEILDIIEMLEAQSDTVSLDSELLALLKEKINSLDIKPDLKKKLLKRVEILEDKKSLQKALASLSAELIKRGQEGKLDDKDVSTMLELLNKIEENI